MKGIAGRKKLQETARGRLQEASGKKKVYVSPKAVVFHPDLEQAESLKGALEEVSDSIALRLVAQIISPKKSGRS